MEEVLDEHTLKQIASGLNLKYKQVENVVILLEEGNTVPFIARYRKELTGGADEVQIRDIMENWAYQQNLKARKTEVLRLIEEQGKLTEALKKSIENAAKLQQVEDLYRPYKQKRRTKATIAKEKGLEPLADIIFKQDPAVNIEEEARTFLSEEKDVISAEDAIAGAQDIIAERVSDEADNRTWIREVTYRKGSIKTSVKNKTDEEMKTYEMYYEYEEPIRKIVPHRVLAVNRGEKEEILKVESSEIKTGFRNVLCKSLSLRFRKAIILSESLALSLQLPSSLLETIRLMPGSILPLHETMILTVHSLHQL